MASLFCGTPRPCYFIAINVSAIRYDLLDSEYTLARAAIMSASELHRDVTVEFNASKRC